MLLLEHYDVVRNIFGLAVSFYFLNGLVFRPLAKRFIPISGSLKNKANKSLVLKQRKFVNSCWKFVSYSFLIAYGFWAIKDQQDWFWSPLKYHDPFPDNKYPVRIDQLYKLEIGYYLFSLVSMFFELGMKDFWVMFAHHLFTLTLLVTSYKYGAVKYGTAIMLLHDVADPLMELAKIVLYSGFEMAANIVFLLFAVTFIYLRDYVYPRHIIWNTYILLNTHNYTSKNITIACLVALWFLHLFWTVLIGKVALQALTGDQKGDVRDTD